MDNQELRTLQILEEIGNEHAPSQRDLARSLNVSLGLVNSFVKRLAHKGYFKVTTIPKNRVRYILTPKGAAEKTRLTYKYIKYSFEFYKNARHKLKTLFQNLEEQGVRRIVFYGASDLAEIAFLSLQETALEVVAIADIKRQGENFLGFQVTDPSNLGSLDFDMLLITVEKSIDSWVKALEEMGIPRDKITILK
jgi:DNA-binding MarR family transcriptional regulator